ncbi:hypothetical protein [Sphingomonas sp. F9_3S_D5_B_2]
MARVAFAPVLLAAPAELRPEPVDPVDGDALDLALLARVPLERDVLDFAREPAALELRPPELLDDPEPDEDASSVGHLPDITRCAASATASAMMLPSLVALDIMLVAACEAVSAASRPASRILRRALGLALIAAAAAARPAASISLLIAALASLSTVLSLPLDDEPEERFPEEPLLADFAIVNPSCATERQSTAVTVPK